MCDIFHLGCEGGEGADSTKDPVKTGLNRDNFVCVYSQPMDDVTLARRIHKMTTA